MQTKLGRNDPCHCGSGEKYKKCCMTSSMPTKKGGAVNTELNNLHDFSLHFIHDLLLPYAEKCLSTGDSSRLAMLEIMIPKLPSEVDQTLMHDLFFVPFYLFNWTIETDEWDQDWEFADDDAKKTVAELYLETYEEWMKPEEKAFLKAMLKTYYSFYSVTAVNLDQTVELKDLLLGTAHTVKIDQATHSLRRGEVIFSRLLTFNGESIMVGMAPIFFPVAFQLFVMEFRDEWLKENEAAAWTTEILQEESGCCLLDCFFELLETLYSSSSELSNSDGERVEFVISEFTLAISPEKALIRLLPLSPSKTSAEILQTAKKNEFGAMESLELPWLKENHNADGKQEVTEMGCVILKQGELLLVVDSPERSKKGETLLKKYLGKAVTLRKTVSQTPQEVLKLLSPVYIQKCFNSSEKIIERPEVQKKIESMRESYWKNWLDKAIPALEDKTPREAVKTPGGRERLEVLLLHYEQENLSAANDFMKVDTGFLKRELGLQ